MRSDQFSRLEADLTHFGFCSDKCKITSHIDVWRKLSVKITVVPDASPEMGDGNE